jgi:hypothetical protein
MRSVLSFPSDDRRPLSEEVSVYLTVISTDLELENLHILTPHVMLWDEGIWLLNLTACLSYWQLEAQAKCETLSQTLQRILDHMSSAHSYHAALASHPWQALLLALQLEDKGFRGLITREGRIGRNLAASLSWDIWWRCCERYVIYDATANAMTTFQQQKRAMQQAMERLTCQSPAQLKSMPVAQIQRRFGGLIASLWDMTFPSVDDRTLGRTAGTHFPWQPQVARKPLSCKRHLDFPSQDWHIIEAFLREDLNRLCVLDSFKKGERILDLEWRIVLYNLQEVLISTLFRHPHSLHHESPHQRTALLQISYAFQRTLRALPTVDTAAPWIVSWELRVTHTLPASPRSLALFGDESAEWEQLITLENQLDRKLEAYRICEDWLPEDSFAPLESKVDIEDLFLCRQPYALPQGSTSHLWKFRERIMDKWWQQGRNNTVRDYYQVLREDNMLWIYRDAQGQCHVHGIYG